ncbi:MAG TPA: ABC transporter permease subunit [Acetobacteraceae bacterium]|jgi:NitT/TauT family transport system permease protein|nr:ABC transporter permease subunit [Acetobacteraceae bacterium]
MLLLAPLFGIATLVAAGAALQALIVGDVISRYVVPPPSDVFAAFERIIVEEHVPARFLLTSAETFAAGVLILAVGVPIGFWLYHSQLLRRAFEPWVAAWAAAPLVLAYPLFLVLFGRSSVTIVIMGFAAGVAPVILKTVEGLVATRAVLIDVGRSLRLTQGQMFRKILFPAAMPAVFTGLRLGLTFSLINIVGVEFLINLGGLGQLINELAERYDLPGTYAAIGFVLLASVVFFAAMERIERWLQRAHG